MRGRLVVAAPLRDVNATVSELTRDEVIIGVLVLALVGGIAYWSVGVGMRPLARIEDTADARSPPATSPSEWPRPIPAPRSGASGSR